MNEKRKDRFNVRSLVLTALFCAMAYALTFIFHIKVSFLTFDAKDTIICISAMLMGPATSTVVALIVSLIELITVSDTGFWGMLMNFISSAVFAGVAGWIYRSFRKMWGAVVGLCSAVVAGTTIMLLLDMLIIPIYTPNVTTGTVITMIPTLLLPFNLVKYILNAALVMAVYKPISVSLRRARVLPGDSSDTKAKDAVYRFGGKSILVLGIALAVCAVCICILIFVLDGSFQLT